MTSVQENLSNLATALKTAKQNQRMALERVQEETQVDVDSYVARIADETSAAVARYYDFKCVLNEAGERVDREFSSIYGVSPESFVFEATIYNGEALVFHSTESDNLSGLVIPIGYFENPEKWEKSFLEWAANINAMTAKAQGLIGTGGEFRPSTIGVRTLGEYFRIYEVTPKEIPGLKMRRERFVVEYSTGEVYAAASLKEARELILTPVAVLK